jgi:methionine-R-sulfoxide reductase
MKSKTNKVKKTQKTKKSTQRKKDVMVLVTLESRITKKVPKIIKSDLEWKKILTPHEFEITRRKGTDKPRFDDLGDSKKAGIYYCKCCKLPLFTSDAKYESHSGWPSFYEPFSNNNVKIIKDYSNNMIRDEVLCVRCDAHLGHLFNDGPPPTGLRYCMNYESLHFIEKID